MKLLLSACTLKKGRFAWRGLRSRAPIELSRLKASGAKDFLSATFTALSVLDSSLKV